MGKRSHGRGRPFVISRHGRHRFQTGLITGTLVASGVPMAEAFEMSKRIRNDITGRTEIQGEELEQLIDAMLREAGYATPPASPDPPTESALFRDLTAIGLDAAEAVELIRRGSGPEVLDTLPQPFDRRCRLLRWMRNADKPVVLFLAGATGTGKSTLALELGVRLGMRLVVSTDMIREVMRTVLSPDLLPGLHDHSFRGMLQGGDVLSDPQERVLAGFHQQAAQVSVGVRGVIRRALRENTHLIVDGTHLQPPFDQYMPAGADAYHAGLMLAVPAKKKHRTRFPARASRQRLRDPNAYLDAFQSVRWIHDDLLHQAEDADVVVIPTEDLQQTVYAALDALWGLVPVTEPVPSAHRRPPPASSADVRTLCLVLDGLADEPQEALGNLTPLAAAETPTLDRLAHGGGQGLIDTSKRAGAVPDTGDGMFAILSPGMPAAAIGRGLIEAAGRGIPLPTGSVLFRGNLATRAPGSLSVLDRRAGRIRSGVEDLIAGLASVPLSGGLVGRVSSSHEHRVSLMIVGAGLSAAVSDTDPGGHADPQRILRPQPLDDTPEAARTAAALREFLDKINTHLEQHPLNHERAERGELPANTILTRGAARADERHEAGTTPVRSAIVAACPSALGVSRLLGMTPVTGPSMTGNLDTDLAAKFDAARPLLHDHDFVVIHIKGTDIASHDRRPFAKRDFITRIDEALGAFLASRDTDAPRLRVVVTADHGTSSATGLHLSDPVPVVLALWDPESDDDGVFTEASAAEGALGRLGPGELVPLLFDSK